MVDATATATADDTANCPAPSRGSAVRSKGSDRKSGGATGWTHSVGNAPERPKTAPNFQPYAHIQSVTCSYTRGHIWMQKLIFSSLSAFPITVYRIIIFFITTFWGSFCGICVGYRAGRGVWAVGALSMWLWMWMWIYWSKIYYENNTRLLSSLLQMYIFFFHKFMRLRKQDEYEVWLLNNAEELGLYKFYFFLPLSDILN